jgi:hypothetical protein
LSHFWHVYGCRDNRDNREKWHIFRASRFGHGCRDSRDEKLNSSGKLVGVSKLVSGKIV